MTIRLTKESKTEIVHRELIWKLKVLTVKTLVENKKISNWRFTIIIRTYVAVMPEPWGSGGHWPPEYSPDRVEHFHNIFVFTFGRDCYCIQQSRPKVKTNMLWKCSTRQSFIFPKWHSFKIDILGFHIFQFELQYYIGT